MNSDSPPCLQCNGINHCQACGACFNGPTCPAPHEWTPQARLENAEILAMSPQDVWAFFAPFMRLNDSAFDVVRDSTETRDLKYNNLKFIEDNQ